MDNKKFTSPGTRSGMISASKKFNMGSGSSLKDAIADDTPKKIVGKGSYFNRINAMKR